MYEAAFHELIGHLNLNTELDIAPHEAKLNDEALSAVCEALGQLGSNGWTP